MTASPKRILSEAEAKAYADVITLLESAYSHKLDPDMQALWIMYLKPYDIEVCQKAAHEQIQMSKWFPKLSEFTDLCEDIISDRKHADRWARYEQESRQLALPRRRTVPTVPLRVYAQLWKAGRHITDEQLKLLAKHRDEFFHLEDCEIMPRVSQILAEEWDPFGQGSA